MDLKYQRPSLCPADSRCDREHRAREVLERRLEPSKALPPQQHGSALAPLAPKRLFNGCNLSSLSSGNLEPAAKPPVIQQHSLRCCGKRHEHALKATPRVLRSRSLICIQGESKLAILGTLLADTEFDSVQFIKGCPMLLACRSAAAAAAQRGTSPATVASSRAQSSSWLSLPALATVSP